MHRFKTAVQNIATASVPEAVEAAVSHFVASLTPSERASIEDTLGDVLSHEAARIPGVAYDLTRAELKTATDDELRSLVAETAQVFIIASNRLSQLRSV